MNNFLNLNRDTMIATGICHDNRRLALLTKQARWRQIRIETGKLIESFTTQIYRKLSLELLIQCGANEPSSAINFCNLNSNNRAICIEANPYIASKYVANNKNKNISYLNIGLGSEPGNLNFYIPEDHPKDWTLQGTFTPTKQLKYQKPFEIQVDTLDNLIPKNLGVDDLRSSNFPNTALLIDVEGFSWEVLQGAKEILSLDKTKAIFIEVQDDNFYWEKEKNAMQISEFLEGYGFIPVARDYPTAPLYNIVFIKVTELDKLVEIINWFWFNFTQIKPNFIEFKDPRLILVRIKKLCFALIPKFLHRHLHIFFKFMGSKSSKF